MSDDAPTGDFLAGSSLDSPQAKAIRTHGHSKWITTRERLKDDPVALAAWEKARDEYLATCADDENLETWQDDLAAERERLLANGGVQESDITFVSPEVRDKFYAALGDAMDDGVAGFEELGDTFAEMARAEQEDLTAEPYSPYGGPHGETVQLTDEDALKFSGPGEPITPLLAVQIQEGIAEAEAGQTTYLGSFAQYAEAAEAETEEDRAAKDAIRKVRERYSMNPARTVNEAYDLLIRTILNHASGLPDDDATLLALTVAQIGRDRGHRTCLDETLDTLATPNNDQ